MKPCTRVGIEVTKRCNWRCKTCFYKHEKDFNEKYEWPIEQLQSQIKYAQSRGCKSAIVIGKGEPLLYSRINELCQWTIQQGMRFSVITNGGAPLHRYQSLQEAGINHYHVSVHDIELNLDVIAGVNNAGKQQHKMLDWMAKENIKWRSNTTLQLENYQRLPEIVNYIIAHGCKHVVLLGFLPHYGWHNRLKEVAVHPAELRSYIEKASEIVLKNDAYLTIRYHPMCHLKGELWPYVTNARYVPYDPFEWCYPDGEKGWPDSPESEVWERAESLAKVGIQGAPCANCELNLHCNGWNATYASEFGGAGLEAVTWNQMLAHHDIDSIIGDLFDLNPVNGLEGWL